MPAPAMRVPSSMPAPSSHENVRCDGCGGAIVGLRWKCANCANHDLCSACEALLDQGGLLPHDNTHVFLKVRACATPLVWC